MEKEMKTVTYVDSLRDDKITYARINARGIYKGGELVGIEIQNGVLSRYKTEHMTNGDADELFGTLIAKH